MHWFLWLHVAWLLIFGCFPCVGVLWPDACCRSSFPRSDLHHQVVAAEFSPDINLFSPLLLNDRSDQSKTCWACSYHHDAPPIAKLWSMDAQISRKMENGWRFQRSISRKPCIGIGWNYLGRLLSPICIFPVKQFFKWMHGFQVRAKTNSVLGIFALRHSAVLLHGRKSELGLWCRYGDDGGGVWRLQEDFWTLEEATMFAKPPFWNPFLASYNFYKNFL